MDGVDATGSSTVRLTSGSHELVVQAVDIFGATSSEVHAFVDLGVTAPEIRSVTIKETDTFSNGYTTAAKELVNISADVIDNEMDAFKVTYQVGGVTTDTPSDYYGLGTYAVKVSAIDIWGNRSTDYNTSFTLSNQKPIRLPFPLMWIGMMLSVLIHLMLRSRLRSMRLLLLTRIRMPSRSSILWTVALIARS